MLVLFICCVPAAWLLTIILAYSYGVSNAVPESHKEGWHAGHAVGWEDARRYYTTEKPIVPVGREWMYN